MPNGILSEAEFENEIKNLSDRQLSEFVARQVYDICKQREAEDKRIAVLEGRDKKFAGALGGVSGAVGAILVSVIDYFVGTKV